MHKPSTPSPAVSLDLITFQQAPEQTDEHGGNVYAAAQDLGLAISDIHDLSTNVFADQAPRTRALLEMELRQNPFPFSLYPAPGAGLLTQELARREAQSTSPSSSSYHDPACLVGSGATELIWAGLLALGVRRVFFLGPLFSEYARACAALGIAWSSRTFSPEHAFIPQGDEWQELASAIQEFQAEAVIVCSPNNPGTGLLDSPALHDSLLRAVGQRALVVDVSYRDFLLNSSSYQAHTYGAWYEARKRALSSTAPLLLIGSMTKFYACPGLRLGYAFSNAALIAHMDTSRPSWSLPPLAEPMGLHLLEAQEEYKKALPGLNKAVHSMALSLAQSPLFSLVLEGPSFVTCRVTGGYPCGATGGPLCAGAYAVIRAQAHAVHDFLLQKFHVLSRTCDTIPGMPPGFLRFGVGTPKARLALIQGLGECTLTTLTCPLGKEECPFTSAAAPHFAEPAESDQISSASSASTAAYERALTHAPCRLCEGVCPCLGAFLPPISAASD